MTAGMHGLLRAALALACLAGGALADGPGEVAHDGLRVRLVMDAGRGADGALLATVGSEFQLTFGVRNETGRTIAVARPDPAHATISYCDPRRGVSGAPPDPPREEDLVVLESGGTMEFQVTATAPLSGNARLAVLLANAWDHAVRKVPSDEGPPRVEKVAREDLWQGTVAIVLPLRAVLGEAPWLGSVARTTRVSRLEAGALTPLEAIEVLTALIDEVRDERIVPILTQRLRVSSHPLERNVCLAGLAVAAQRGYGWNAIPGILDRATAEEATGEERVLGVEVAALVTGKDYRPTTPDLRVLIRLPVPEELRSRAVAFLRTAATEEGAAGERARAALRDVR